MEWVDGDREGGGMDEEGGGVVFGGYRLMKVNDGECH
jgi:hypothetical protein